MVPTDRLSVQQPHHMVSSPIETVGGVGGVASQPTRNYCLDFFSIWGEIIELKKGSLMKSRKVTVAILGLTLCCLSTQAFFYEVIPGPFTWDQAKQDAESRGGYLATITSGAEGQDVVAQIGLPIPFFSDSPPNNPGTIGTITGVWLGATDLQGGQRSWITGEPWSFTRRAPGEPSGSGVYGPEHYQGSVGNDVPEGGSTLSILAVAVGFLCLVRRHFNRCPSTE
jgi:hypothetical protein